MEYFMNYHTLLTCLTINNPSNGTLIVHKSENKHFFEYYSESYKMILQLNCHKMQFLSPTSPKNYTIFEKIKQTFYSASISK